MYAVELVINDATESNFSASYLDLLLAIGRDGKLHTSIFEKRDDFKLSESQLQYSLRRFYITAYTIFPGLLLIWLFYSEGSATFQ